MGNPWGYIPAPKRKTGRYCAYAFACCFIYRFLRKLITMDADFGPAGARLVESITSEFDFSSEPAKQALLLRAARTTDRIAQLEEAAAQSPLMVKGSQGQQVISPLIAEARAQTSLLDKLLKSLGLPDSDEDTAAKAEQRRRQAKKAAKTRWGNRS